MGMEKKTRLLAVTWVLLMSIPAWAEQTPSADDPPSGFAVEEPSARDEILQSSRWRRVRRSFDEWLSVQKIYTDQQVAEIREELRRRIDSMTAIELEDFLYDMEERLEVLMSDEVKDARNWLSVLTMEARRRQLVQDGELPDLFGMTVTQLRQELRRFEQQRAGQAAAHSEFNRQREQQVATAMENRRAQENARLQDRQRAADAALRQQRNNTFQSPYAPHHAPASRDTHRFMHVSPWGGVSFVHSF